MACDGFTTLEDLITTLSEKNDMTVSDVMAWEWPVIRYKWTKGPLRSMPVTKIA